MDSNHESKTGNPRISALMNFRLVIFQLLERYIILFGKASNHQADKRIMYSLRSKAQGVEASLDRVADFVVAFPGQWSVDFGGSKSIGYLLGKINAF